MKAMCAYGHTKVKCNANKDISRFQFEMRSPLIQKGTILTFAGHNNSSGYGIICNQNIFDAQLNKGIFPYNSEYEFTFHSKRLKHKILPFIAFCTTELCTRSDEIIHMKSHSQGCDHPFIQKETCKTKSLGQNCNKRQGLFDLILLLTYSTSLQSSTRIKNKSKRDMIGADKFKLC